MEGESPAMPIAGRIEDHQARCQPHLLRLRMLAHGETGTVLPRQVVGEVVRATGAILAEAEAASGDARAAARDGPGSPGALTLLRVRLNRVPAPATAARPAAPPAQAPHSRRPPLRRDCTVSTRS